MFCSAGMYILDFCQISLSLVSHLHLEGQIYPENILEIFLQVTQPTVVTPADPLQRGLKSYSFFSRSEML